MLATPGSDCDDDSFSLNESDFDEEAAREDFGYYVGETKFTIRVHGDVVKRPDKSFRMPGALNIYSPTAFNLRQAESRQVGLDLTLIVPEGRYVKFQPREALIRCTGVFVAPTIFGPGKLDKISFTIRGRKNIFCDR